MRGMTSGLRGGQDHDGARRMVQAVARDVAEAQHRVHRVLEAAFGVVLQQNDVGLPSSALAVMWRSKQPWRRCLLTLKCEWCNFGCCKKI